MTVDVFCQGYTVMPRALSLALNQYFSPSTRCVYRTLYDVANYKEQLKTHYTVDRGQLDISQREAGRLAGVSYKSVRHAYKILEDYGLITTEKVGRGAEKLLVTICLYSEMDDMQNYRGAVGAHVLGKKGRTNDAKKDNDNNDLQDESKNRGARLEPIGAHNINTVIKHNKDTEIDWMEILRLKQLELDARNAG